MSHENRPSGIRRIVAASALAIGLFLVVSPFALDYPAKTQGVDGLTDSLRAAMTDGGLAQLRSDMDTINAFVAQFENEAAPQLAVQLTEAGALARPEDLNAFIAASFPDLGKGLAQFDDQILPYFNTVVDGLHAEQGDFRRADAIPTGFLPATSVPFIFLAIGLVVIAVSLAGLVGWRPSSAALAGIGLVMVVVVFALQMPAKTQSVDDLTGAFRGVFTDAGAQQSRDYYTTVAAAGGQLQQQALPAIAEALGTDVDTLAAGLAEQFPDVGRGLQDLPAILSRFDGLVTAVESNIDNFAKADSIPTAGQPTTLFTWHLLGPGLLLLVLGAAAVVVNRRTGHDVAPTSLGQPLDVDSEQRAADTAGARV